jgi:hypothetical protein
MKMSKQNNVNPDYYKLAGRERQGEGIVQDLQKQTFAEQQAETERWQERQSGPPPWKATPPSTSVEPESKSTKSLRRARQAKKTPRRIARRQVRSTKRSRAMTKTAVRARTRSSAKSRSPRRKRA